MSHFMSKRTQRLLMNAVKEHFYATSFTVVSRCRCHGISLIPISLHVSYMPVRLAHDNRFHCPLKGVYT